MPKSPISWGSAPREPGWRHLPPLPFCSAAERNAISRLLHKAGCGPSPLVTFAKQPAQVFEGKVRGVCPQQGVWDPAGQPRCWGSGAQSLQKESC